MLEVRFLEVAALPQTLGDSEHPLVVMPFTDAGLAARAATQLARRAGMAGTLVAINDEARAGFIAVANAAFRRSRAPCFAYVAQDAFAGRDWLLRAERSLRTGGGLHAFQDGKWSGLLAAFGLAERGWADANYDGDLFCPAYRRHYADVELTLLASQCGRLRHDPAAVLIEVDWDKEAARVDADDRATFRQRRADGFDGRVTCAQLQQMFD